MWGCNFYFTLKWIHLDDKSLTAYFPINTRDWFSHKEHVWLWETGLRWLSMRTDQKVWKENAPVMLHLSLLLQLFNHSPIYCAGRSISFSCFLPVSSHKMHLVLSSLLVSTLHIDDLGSIRVYLNIHRVLRAMLCYHTVLLLLLTCKSLRGTGKLSLEHDRIHIVQKI